MSSTKEQLEWEFQGVLYESCPSDLENPLDEVYPGIFIGDKYAAQNTDILDEHGITHVLSAAFVPYKTHFHLFDVVKTDQGWYDIRNYKCTFKGIEVVDTPGFNIAKYFEEVADFIDSALQSGCKILVHCYAGMSRSATFVIAYLMIKQKMRAKDAIALIRQKRACYPNFGFVDQIIELDMQLQGLQ